MALRTGYVTVLSAILLGSGPAPLPGQGWTADLHAGQASWETAPVASRSTHAILGLRYASQRRHVHTALAAPLASGDPTWGVASLSQRMAARRGRLEWGVDASALVHGQQDPAVDGFAWGVRGEVLPLVGWSMGPLVVEGRSGASLYRGDVGGTEWSRTLHLSDLRLLLPLADASRVGGEVRHLRASEEAYTFLGGTLSLAGNRGAAWGSVGSWISGLSAAEPAASWGVGASLGVTAATALWTSVRREPFDPLYLGAPRTSWGVGVSHRLGTSGSGSSGTAVVPRHRSGTLVRIPLGEASHPPYVAGDFSGWSPVPMHRNGLWWEATLDLAPGLHHLAFQRADGSWFVPEGMPNRRSDGMGGWVAVVLIPGEGGSR
jgi:hypothetical protein